MCTVTFIPLKNKYILTSNRDEKISRKNAVPPTVHTINKSKLLFPKDASAGGTWIALHENGNAAVLLNGAFVKHASTPGYKKSRGKVLLEIIEAANPVRFFMRMDLSLIEPFTVVVFEDNSLYECRWDGLNKHCVQLKKNRHHIWSSSTLYDGDVAKKREQWFAAFLNRHPNPTQEDILNFHQYGGEGDRENDLNIDRNGLMSTVSVTSISLDNETGSMKYIDLKQNRISEEEINFIYSLHDEAIY